MLQSVFGGEASTPNRTPAFIGIISSLASFALFIAGLTNLQLFQYLIINRQRINDLEDATMAVELANLQNQVNPHFLFNMLNNANIMAGEDTEKSSHILSKLNDLLRYQVEKGSEKSVKLKDDVDLLRDYLELEKMRRDRFNYTIQLEGNAHIEVPPLLFIPFVENAVKHNPENDSFVNVIFRVTPDELYFECKNPKAKSSQTKKEGGIGLVNIKRRLDLLFERNYTLTLSDEKEAYIATMKLKL
jgi:LytS/YehU family sensor histidine kinase